MGNSQTGLSRGEQRNRTVNRIIERHSILEDAISSILSPAASATLTPHFFCSKVDVVWMRTFGTLLFYLLIYFFPEREIDVEGEMGLWTDCVPALTFCLPCLVGSVCFFSLYFLILSLFSFHRSSMFGSLCFFLSPRSRSFSAS